MISKKSRYSMTAFLAVLMVLAGFGMNMELKGEVTGVKLTVSPSNYTGPCPKLFKFTGRIMVKKDKVSVYRYRWIRSDGSYGPVKGGSIVRDSSVIVTSEWLYGGNGNTYRNQWKQIQILPNHYKIDAMHNYIKPLMSSNKAFFTLNCRQPEVKNPERENLTINNAFTRVRLPVWEISGRISPKHEGCNSCLEGRKIRIILRKAAQDGNPATVTRHVYTLDGNSSYNYKFRSPFITAGTYTIIVEKGPVAQSSHSNNLNICFTGADPIRKTVTLTSSNKKALNQDFKIDYTILWGGGQPLCW